MCVYSRFGWRFSFLQIDIKPVHVVSQYLPIIATSKRLLTVNTNQVWGKTDLNHVLWVRIYVFSAWAPERLFYKFSTTRATPMCRTRSTSAPTSWSPPLALEIQLENNSLNQCLCSIYMYKNKTKVVFVFLWLP